MRYLLLALILLSGCAKPALKTNAVKAPWPQGTSVATGCPLGNITTSNTGGSWLCTQAGLPDLSFAIYNDGSAHWASSGAAYGIPISGTSLIPIQKAFPTCETDYYMVGGNNYLVAVVTNVTEVAGALTGITWNGDTYTSCVWQ